MTGLLRWGMSWWVFTIVAMGCGGTTRQVRLETGRGEPLSFTPRPADPVELDDDDFIDAVETLAKDVRPSASPRLVAHRLLTNSQGASRGRLRLVSAEGDASTWRGRMTTSDTDSERTKAYRHWCERKDTPGDCLGLLTPDLVLGEDGKRTLALSFALDAVWDETHEAPEDMAEPVAVQATIVISMAVYLTLWVLPEPLSKGAAASLIAWLGVDTVLGLVRGWIRLTDETRAATTFDQVSAAGERFGEVLGVNTARAFVMLATATIGSTVSLAMPRLPRWPRDRAVSTWQP